MTKAQGYNERLFGSGIRGWIHSSRFLWVAKTLAGISASASVVELGCFDGKILRSLPTLPRRYLGFDANWEGGLDLAKADWSEYPNFEFRQCATPAEFAVGDEQFDVGICMETLEHIPPADLHRYLDMLALIVRGEMLVTVPNETGLFFLCKRLAKRLMRHSDHYSWREIFWLTLGCTDKVTRDQHKGFSWSSLVEQVGSRFVLHKVQGCPLSWLPPSLNPTICIIALARGKDPQ